MRGCRDICHGFKHKALKSPSLDADFNLYRAYDPFAEEIDPRQNPESYRIAFAHGNDIRSFDVFDFAATCFDNWITFLHDHGLVRDDDSDR
jgi:hypothetical protein